jgi:uncharacterized membrane protein YfcA
MVMALASAGVTLAIYVRKGLLRVRDSLLMIACSTALGFASSQLVRYVNDGILQRSFGVFLIVLAILVWFGHLGEGDRSAPPLEGDPGRHRILGRRPERPLRCRRRPR